MTIYELNDIEKSKLDKWLNSRKIKAALKKGAVLSLSFPSGGGIGRCVRAHLDLGEHPDDMVIYPPVEFDITDYESW